MKTQTMRSKYYIELKNYLIMDNKDKENILIFLLSKSRLRYFQPRRTSQNIQRLHIYIFFEVNRCCFFNSAIVPAKKVSKLQLKAILHQFQKFKSQTKNSPSSSSPKFFKELVICSVFQQICTIDTHFLKMYHNYERENQSLKQHQVG